MTAMTKIDSVHLAHEKQLDRTELTKDQKQVAAQWACPSDQVVGRTASKAAICSSTPLKRLPKAVRRYSTRGGTSA